MNITYGPFTAKVRSDSELSDVASGTRYVADSALPTHSMDVGRAPPMAETAGPLETSAILLEPGTVSLSSHAWTVVVSRRHADVVLHPEFEFSPLGVDGLFNSVGICWTILAGGLLLHASAVRTSRGALLFCGESGVGKSTTARLLAGDSVLADDHCLLFPTTDGWRAQSAPTWRKGSAKPHRVFFIEQAESTVLLPLDRSSALRLLLKNTVLWHSDRALYDLVLSNAVQALEAAEYLRLHVSLDQLDERRLVGAP